MNIGDILVAKGLITEGQVAQALEYQKEHGGRLGDCLQALGILDKEKVDQTISEAPAAPIKIEDTGIDHALLLALVLKGILMERLETGSQLSDALKLSGTMITRLLGDLKDRKLVEPLGMSLQTGSIAEIRYALSGAGRTAAAEALENSQYFGPAPVPLVAYQERILRQRITNELISRDMLKEAFKNLVMPDRFLDRLGPAVNSGHPILIYGPAGNGKTTVAEIVGKIFQNVVYIPYCIEIGGEIIKVYDPTVHRSVIGAGGGNSGPAVRLGPIDRRWVPCFRPMVMTGGELTLDMLDLKFNHISKFYEAPLHVKALNGVFLIDDFGRQRVKPEDILNRWIVPLNSKIDYLTLHSGKSVQIPFDEIVIFSTNLHPSDLMDPAFQRRINYKLETLEPDEGLLRRVFDGMAAKQGLELSDEIFALVVAGIRENNAPLAYFQPKFIVEQVLASCKFQGVKPQFTPENIGDALSNLFVKSSGAKMGVVRSA